VLIKHVKKFNIAIQLQANIFLLKIRNDKEGKQQGLTMVRFVMVREDVVGKGENIITH
jgi:hypothetical protein